MGALTSSQTGQANNPHDGELTFLGKVLASLPVDTKLGKLMMLGHAFGLLEECIIISTNFCFFYLMAVYVQLFITFDLEPM